MFLLSKDFTKTMIVLGLLDVYSAFTLIYSIVILYYIFMRLKHGYIILKKLVLFSKRCLLVELATLVHQKASQLSGPLSESTASCMSACIVKEHIQYERMMNNTPELKFTSLQGMGNARIKILGPLIRKIFLQEILIEMHHNEDLIHNLWMSDK
jgi:hypothetical protein